MGRSADIKVVYGVDLGYVDGDTWCPEAWDEEEGEQDYAKVEVAEHESGANVVSYGYEGSSKAIGILASVGIIEWSGPIEPSHLVADPSWAFKVAQLADKLGIDISGKRIGWNLVAHYG